MGHQRNVIGREKSAYKYHWKSCQQTNVIETDEQENAIRSDQHINAIEWVINEWMLNNILYLLSANVADRKKTAIIGLTKHMHLSHQIAH